MKHQRTSHPVVVWKVQKDLDWASCHWLTMTENPLKTTKMAVTLTSLKWRSVRSHCKFESTQTSVPIRDLVGMKGSTGDPPAWVRSTNRLGFWFNVISVESVRRAQYKKQFSQTSTGPEVSLRSSFGRAQVEGTFALPSLFPPSSVLIRFHVTRRHESGRPWWCCSAPPPRPSPTSPVFAARCLGVQQQESCFALCFFGAFQH